MLEGISLDTEQDAELSLAILGRSTLCLANATKYTKQCD